MADRIFHIERVFQNGTRLTISVEGVSLRIGFEHPASSGREGMEAVLLGDDILWFRRTMNLAVSQLVKQGLGRAWKFRQVGRIRPDKDGRVTPDRDGRVKPVE